MIAYYLGRTNPVALHIVNEEFFSPAIARTIACRVRLSLPLLAIF